MTPKAFIKAVCVAALAIPCTFFMPLLIPFFIILRLLRSNKGFSSAPWAVVIALAGMLFFCGAVADRAARHNLGGSQGRGAVGSDRYIGRELFKRLRWCPRRVFRRIPLFRKLVEESCFNRQCLRTLRPASRFAEQRQQAY